MYRQSVSRNSSFSGSASKITFICSSEGLRRIIPYYSGNIGYRIHIHFNQFLCFIHTKLLYIFGKVLFKGLFEKTGKVNFRYTEAVCHGYQGQLRIRIIFFYMFPYSLFNIIGFLLSDFSDQIFFIIPLDNAFEGLIFIIQQGTYVFKSGRNPADIGYRIPWKEMLMPLLFSIFSLT